MRSIAPSATKRLIERMTTGAGLTAAPAQPAYTDPELDELTDREREVLIEIARGLSNQEIADKLFIGLPTVKTHVAHIWQRSTPATMCRPWCSPTRIIWSDSAVFRFRLLYIGRPYAGINIVAVRFVRCRTGRTATVYVRLFASALRQRSFFAALAVLIEHCESCHDGGGQGDGDQRGTGFAQHVLFSAVLSFAGGDSAAGFGVVGLRVRRSPARALGSRS